MKRIIAIGVVLGVLATTFGLWTTLGLPLPASHSALAANTEADMKWRLAHWAERRDKLYEQRDSYRDIRNSLPPWLRSSIRSVCGQIVDKKKRLKINPARCDD